MGHFRYLFFDLDGTLADSERGIAESVRYSLRHFGIEENDRSTLIRFIGPPLEDSYHEIYGFTPEQCDEAVRLYREAYLGGNIDMVSCYPGIGTLLRRTQEAGLFNILCSSKPTPMAARVLKTLDLLPFFSLVCGAEIERGISRKSDVVRLTLKELGAKHPGFSPRQVLMIGDREYDITGAADNGIAAAGVSWGFAAPGELEAAGAVYVAQDTGELARFILDS